MTAVQAALFAAILYAAPTAEAVIYRWTDENGTVTYSNSPPTGHRTVRDLTKIEDISPDLGKRESETMDAGAGKNAAGTAVAPPAATSSPTPVPAAPDTAGSVAPRRATTRPLETEAVRDPCLRSPDPQCHLKNRDKYHPYLGYAPSTVPRSPVGATGGAGAGGTVGGTSLRPEPTR